MAVAPLQREGGQAQVVANRGDEVVILRERHGIERRVGSPLLVRNGAGRAPIEQHFRNEAAERQLRIDGGSLGREL